MNQEDALDRAVGDWLIEKETDPALLPGEFARRLPKELASLFLRELEQLAAIDGLTTQASPRDLPLRYGDFRVLGELGRGGRQGKVTVYRLIARDTIEEKVLQLQREKKQLVDAVLSADKSLLAKLTREDLAALLA